MAELRPPTVSHPLLADVRLAEMVRDGVLSLPTVVREGPPPRLPVAPLDEILAELDASRRDR